MRLRVDLKRAAQLYVDSSEAQHGDLELAAFMAVTQLIFAGLIWWGTA